MKPFLKYDEFLLEKKWEKEAEIRKNNEEIQLEIYSSVKCHVFRHPLKTNSHLLTKSKSYWQF